MKNQIRQLRRICEVSIKDAGFRADAMELLEDIKRWANAQFPLEDLDEMSENLDQQILRLSAIIKLNTVFKEVNSLFGEDCIIQMNNPASEQLQDIIHDCREKKQRCDRLRTLYSIDKMTEISK